MADAGPALLVYCRAGFEKDAAAELTSRARARGEGVWCRTGLDTGYLTLHCAQRPGIERLWREIRWRELVFARQWLCRFALLTDLPADDRAAPIAAETGTAIRRLNRLCLDWPDTNAGKTMARFARRFRTPLAQSLARAGVRLNDPDAPDLHVFMPDSGQAHLALADPANANPEPSGVRRLRLHPEAPSRSALKLEEALLTLVPEEVRAAIGPGVAAVDLGAAPGGWSWHLARRGVTVTAVDNGPLEARLLAEGFITHVRADGFRFRPSSPVQWVVCDIVEQPHRIARLMGQWLARGDARFAVFNLKLPMKKRHEAIVAALADVNRLAATAGRPVSLRCKQLYHDREEVTVFAAPAGTIREHAVHGATL